MTVFQPKVLIRSSIGIRFFYFVTLVLASKTKVIERHLTCLRRYSKDKLNAQSAHLKRKYHNYNNQCMNN